MKQVPQILASYYDVDGHLLTKFNVALKHNDVVSQEEIRRRRTYNDNAYFLLLWGQIENEINEKCTRLIARSKNRSSWRVRRVFYNLDPDRMKIEDRLSLLVDKQAGRGSPWAKSISLYVTRNKIAHGESGLSGVSIPAVVTDLYQIQAALKV